MGCNLAIEIDSLHKFYQECDIVTKDGNKSEWNEINTSDRPYFTGLSLNDIPKFKYHYKPGLKNLVKIDGDLNVGGSKIEYKFDEFDGDDMVMERYYEGMPAMKKRKKKGGLGTGKFITVHCNIGELSHIDHTRMSYKAYTCVGLIDFLEGLGYRVGVSVFAYTSHPGTYRGETVNTLLVDVMIKKHEDPLNTSLLLTTMSPWMLRYHMFKFRAAKMWLKDGYGRSLRIYKKDTVTDIWIDNGECLNNSASKHKIASIKKLFSKDIK